MVENWTRDITQFTSNLNWNEKIFDIIQKKNLEIVVNFDDRMISLFKEIRNLTYMKIKISSSLQFKAEDA